jgi:hypothetical protein
MGNSHASQEDGRPPILVLALASCANTRTIDNLFLRHLATGLLVR